MKQIFRKKKFTVEVVHFKIGDGHFEIRQDGKLVAREHWVKDPLYYQTHIIPNVIREVKKLLEDLKF
jgi:hypothetical protein